MAKVKEISKFYIYEHRFIIHMSFLLNNLFYSFLVSSYFLNQHIFLNFIQQRSPKGGAIPLPVLEKICKKPGYLLIIQAKFEISKFGPLFLHFCEDHLPHRSCKSGYATEFIPNKIRISKTFLVRIHESYSYEKMCKKLRQLQKSL